METIHHLPQPVIAQVEGIATAAGCQLVAACDLAVATDDSRFGTPGVKIGLFCSTPMVPLSRAVGRKRAMEMLLTGEMIDAERAREWGLVNLAILQVTGQPDADPPASQGYANEDLRASNFVDLIYTAFACDLSRVASFEITSSMSGIVLPTSLGITYRTAWLWVQAINRAWGSPLVSRVRGGLRAGTSLTPEGRAALKLTAALR